MEVGEGGFQGAEGCAGGVEGVIGDAHHVEVGGEEGAPGEDCFVEVGLFGVAPAVVEVDHDLGLGGEGGVFDAPRLRSGGGRRYCSMRMWFPGAIGGRS